VPLTLLSATLLLVGCHSSDDGKPSAGHSSTSTTSSTPGPHGPPCKDIWRDGATLPKDYKTCDENGAAGQQDVTKCKDGSTLIAYSDIYFAVPGGKISKPKLAPMQDTPEFGKAYASCTGE
jgi:hypothetical protein